jgi:DNA-binding MarR family transcriptional regulator
LRRAKGAYTLFAVATINPVSRAELEEVASGCACLSVRRAARAMSRAYDDELRETGLRMTQVSTLVAVGLHGQVTVTRLAETLDLERTTLTRELKPLRERGLLTVRAGDDRRERIVELTDAGSEALSDAIPRWRAAQQRALAGIDAAAWRTLLGHLDRAATQAAAEKE